MYTMYWAEEILRLTKRKTKNACNAIYDWMYKNTQIENVPK